MTKDDSPPLSRRELNAWYSADFANSVFFQVVIGAYLVLLLQQMALQKAGFPHSCPNFAAVRHNNNLSMQVFGEVVDHFFIDNMQTGKSECTTPCEEFEGDHYCQGLPQSSLECLSADGEARHRLHVSIGSWKIEPTEYAMLFLGLSVIVQTIGFLLFGALGDFGDLRKRVYAVTTWLGSLACVCCIAVTPDLWWLGGVFMIIANFFFGMSVLMYNAWLPLLVKAHWDYLALPPNTTVDVRRAKHDEIAGSVSSWGFTYGYLGGFLCLILTVPIAVFVNSEDAYRINVVLAGCWWFGFSWISILYLEPRPGPPLPKGSTYTGHSLNEFKVTMGRLTQLPSTCKYLLCWFGYSDGVAVIGATAVLFANTEVDWGCIPKILGIAVLLLGTPLLAMVGLVVVDRYAKRHSWQPKPIILVSLAVLSVIPIYGLIGFASDDVGLHYGWELLVMMVFFALPLGVMQSYSRAYFTSAIPAGYESQFFGMFEVTDKGSSIISPIVVSQIAANHDFRYVFIYVLIIIVVPALCLIPLDPKLAHTQAADYAAKNPRIDELEQSKPRDDEGEHAESSNMGHKDIVLQNDLFVQVTAV
mmetsp:Transcript_26030/g.68309  ORF Transcript_26030/g.68309 Transcript_26030/m.68309 type:complete len:586 (-) Transcript_26030:2793-4550(-)